ncbi:MAG: RNA polymerase sigma-70 factor [Gemmatimonadaceae bacterium]|nr:RNA polymerase sigma-70 factor [Gemmatimonadaceae bacterium]
MAIDPHAEQQLAAVRGGDRDAFERLFRAWYGRLADYTVRLVEQPDTAEDIVQNVLIALWNRREALPEAGALPAYLYRACRNRALNALRDHRRSGVIPFPTIDEPSIAPAVETALHVADLDAVLQEALNSLAPRTREVFLLSREQDLTYTQIADTLGISVKTVETLMGRALRALRERLRPQLDG